MPLESYGVLKGSVVDARREDDPNTPHYQAHVRADDTSYRVAIARTDRAGRLGAR